MDEPSTSTASFAANSNPRKSQVSSCAECRRLKLRCDRIFPCSSCIRRGCANLCPTGTLEKGKRGFLKRLEQSLPSVKPGVEIEHSEVAMFLARDNAMGKRIKELEDALAAAGVSIPPTASVLADAPTFRIPSPPQENEGRAKRPRIASLSDAQPPASKDRDSSAADVTLGIGTLTIDVENRPQYVSTTSGAAYPDLWRNAPRHMHNYSGSQDQNATSQDEHLLPSELVSRMALLPAYDEAHRLAHLYFSNASFMYEVVPEDIFFTVHFPTIYMDPLRAACIPSNLHVLSLFAMVLAIGALFDLALPIAEVQPRSAELYAVALSALDLRFPVNFDSISAAQTLHLMALWFLCMRGEEGGDSAWQALGLAMRSIVAQECHRDDSSWGVPPREAEERRRVFWETLVFDRLQSFTLGRPYALSDAHHNCEMPQTCDTPLPSDTDPEDRVFSHLKWHTLKFRFALLLGRIVDTVFNARQTPTYEVVLDMDRDVQSYYASLPGWAICEAVEHPVTALPSPDELRPAKDGLQMRRDAQIASLANMCFLAILDLHRGPFCRALMLGGRNLVSSKYKQSVESLTNAARAMINVARGLFARHPRLFSRMWYWIFHSFTAAVCQAVFVIVAPRHPLAPAAYESMQSALHLYARADGEHSKAASERLVRLAAQARSEMDKAHRVASISIEDTPPTRVAFPTSNIRGNVAEDFLGTSPTLVRSAPEPQHDKDASQHSPWPQPESDWIDHSYQFDTQTRLFHSEQLGSQQYSASRYFSDDGFDVTAFIQSGARPWMFDN